VGAAKKSTRRTPAPFELQLVNYIASIKRGANVSRKMLAPCGGTCTKSASYEPSEIRKLSGVKFNLLLETLFHPPKQADAQRDKMPCYTNICCDNCHKTAQGVCFDKEEETFGGMLEFLRTVGWKIEYNTKEKLISDLVFTCPPCVSGSKKP